MGTRLVQMMIDMSLCLRYGARSGAIMSVDLVLRASSD